MKRGGLSKLDPGPQLQKRDRNGSVKGLLGALRGQRRHSSSHLKATFHYCTFPCQHPRRPLRDWPCKPHPARIQRLCGQRSYATWQSHESLLLTAPGLEVMGISSQQQRVSNTVPCGALTAWHMARTSIGSAEFLRNNAGETWWHLGFRMAAPAGHVL